MYELFTGVASILNFLLALIIIITFFVLTARIRKIKEILEGKFTDKNPKKIMELSRKEEFKGNMEIAKNHMLEALYYEIEKYLQDYSYINNTQRYEEIENIVKKYQHDIDRFGAKIPDVREFY